MTSNTPHSNGHSGPRATGGEDYLTLTMRVSFNSWSALRDILEQAKEAAANRNKRHGSHRNVFIRSGFEICVHPNGRMVGDRFFRFVIECRDIVFGVADKAGPAECEWNVHAEASGMACLNHGLEGCLATIYGLIKALDGEIDDERVSRVDDCTDLAGVGIEVFAAADRDKRYITRVIGHRVYDEPGYTLQYGRGDLQLKIYDKLAETNPRRSSHKLELMINRRWGGVTPPVATRVEFQLRGRALRRRGIRTVADYLEKRSDLVSYLTKSWFKYTANKVDRQNQKRAITLPEWESVTKTFAAWAGEPLGVALTPILPPPLDEVQFFRQAHGCVRRIAESRGSEAIQLTDFVDLLDREAIHVP